MDRRDDISGLSALREMASGGDPDIRIAIIDGPVDLTHAALSNPRIKRGDAVAPASSGPVRSEHGTHITSVLMGSPDGPVPGIVPNCTATVYSIYRESPAGEIEPSSQATLALAINRAVADGADVINISSGQKSATGQAERVLADAVRRCAEAGTLIVAAAGNDGCRCVHVPGALDAVLAVGACDRGGAPLPFSNFGDIYQDNGIMAVGDRIKGASPTEGVSYRSGTSFAAPIVSGVVALLLSCLKQRGRDPDPFTVRDALLASAVPCPPTGDALRCLAGRLDIPAAVAAVLGDQEAVEDLTAPRPPVRAANAIAVEAAATTRSVTPSTAAREGTMGDLSMTTQAAAPIILGPDGAALPRTAGLTPSEATSSAPGAAGAEAGGPMVMPVAMPTAGAHAAEGTRAVTPSVAPMQTIPADPRSPMRVRGTDCGCGMRPSEAGTGAQMAFPIGQLYYDFGLEARLDYFVQAIASWRDNLQGRGDPAFGPDRDKAGDSAAPYNPEIMVRYLLNLAEGETRNPTGYTNFPDADAITWTLTIDTVPIYAIRPAPVFGLGFYGTLINTLWFQEVSPVDPTAMTAEIRAASSGQSGDTFPPKGSVARVSLAGSVDSADTMRLLNGTVVPVLQADWRGFYTWNLDTLLGQDRAAWPPGVEGFLDRIYNEFRNVGLAPQDRALNYSAMNAYNTKRIFASVAAKGMRLDTVEVDRSVICRPDSNCWDVTFRFFDPTQVLTQARQVYQYTIDVSDFVPVPVGPLRQWQVY